MIKHSVYIYFLFKFKFLYGKNFEKDKQSIYQSKKFILRNTNNKIKRLK